MCQQRERARYHEAVGAEDARASAFLAAGLESEAHAKLKTKIVAGTAERRIIEHSYSLAAGEYVVDPSFKEAPAHLLRQEI